MSFAGRLSLELFGFLLAIATGSGVLVLGGLDGLDGLGLGCLLVNTLDIRVRWGDSSGDLTGPAAFGHGNLVTVLINDARLGRVLGFELNFAFQGLDLLFVQQVSVLIPIFDLFLLGEDLYILLDDSCLRNNRLRERLLGLVNNRIDNWRRRSSA